MKSTKKPQYGKCDYGNGEGAEVAPRGPGNKIMPAEQSGLLRAQCLWAGNCSPGQLSQCRAQGLRLSLCRKESFFQADREWGLDFSSYSPPLLAVSGQVHTALGAGAQALVGHRSGIADTWATRL